MAVSPTKRSEIGDDVIVQLRRPHGDDERVTMVLVKELVRRSVTFVELRQHNRPETFKIATKEIAAMHKVMGHYI